MILYWAISQGITLAHKLRNRSPLLPTRRRTPREVSQRRINAVGRKEDVVHQQGVSRNHEKNIMSSLHFPRLLNTLSI